MARRNSVLNEEERVVQGKNIYTGTNTIHSSKESIDEYKNVNTSIENSSQEEKSIEHLKTPQDATTCRMEPSYHFTERNILSKYIKDIHNKYHREHTTNNAPLFFTDATYALQNKLAPKEARNITETGRKHSSQKLVSSSSLHCCNERECNSCSNNDLRCNDLNVSQVQRDMCKTNYCDELQVEHTLKDVLQMFTSNCFECCIYSALDIVIEAVHTSRAYHHWAVMSTLSNYFVLSMKSLTTFNVAKCSIEEGKLDQNDKEQNEQCISQSPVEKMLSNLRKLSEPIAMYENMVDILLTFKALLYLLNGESILSRDQRENNIRKCVQSQNEMQQNREGRRKAELSKEELGEEAIENLQSDRNTYMQVMLRLNVQSHIIRVAETLPFILEVDHVLFQMVQDICLLDYTILELRRKNVNINNDGRQNKSFKSALHLEEEEQLIDALKLIHQQEEEEDICASSVPCEVSSSIKSFCTTPITSSLNAQLIETEDVNMNNESLTSQNVCIRERPPLSSVEPRMSVESTHHSSSPHSNLAKSFFKSMFGVHSTCESKNNESGSIHDNVHKCMNQKEAKVLVPNKTFAGLSKSFFHFDRSSKGEHNTKHASKTNVVSRANSQMDIHHDLSNEMHDTSHRHRSDTPLGRFFNKTKNQEKKNNKKLTHHDEIQNTARNDSMCSDYSISTSTNSSCASIYNNNDNMKSQGVYSTDIQDDKISKNTCVGDNDNSNVNNSQQDSSIKARHSLFVVEASANYKNGTAAQEHSTTHLNKQHYEEEEEY